MVQTEDVPVIKIYDMCRGQDLRQQ